MTHCNYSEELRQIDMVMRNFKVIPYPEVAETLDQATKDTIAFLNKR
ncbi:hypothetical protein MsAc7_06240 [Methanolapillus millepedarum]|uniref:Uncharacterized protein n=1 Tax=Methanolapillus millepedarum TaxID=3028296 RepID=A0AA96ZU02_9EURY|nr:hypothetical protein MsAc7_06240 [Methanosarcinaceae archaeon Ac7]